MPLRHSVLWVLRDTTTREQQGDMLKGLAYLAVECRDVRAGDYGDDLFGGSQELRDVPAWKRTPRWRLRDRPPAAYDMALHLDFDSQAALDGYNRDPIHDAASDFNASVAWDEFTARVDWEYDEPPLMKRGHLRHVAMFIWGEQATEDEKLHAFEAVGLLRSAPGVLTVTTGTNFGHLPTDFDWILDVQLADTEAARGLLDGAQYAEAMQSVAAVTKFEWTARMTHVIRGW